MGAKYGTVALWWVDGGGRSGCWRHGDSEQVRREPPIERIKSVGLL